MRRGDLGDVRGVQDDLAAVGHDRLDLVEALGARSRGRRSGGRRATRTRCTRVRRGTDVGLGGDVGRRRPRVAAAAPKATAAGRRCRGRPTTQRAWRSPGTSGGGGVDQRPDRRDAPGADDLGAGDERAEPVGDVDQLLAGQARGTGTCRRRRSPTTSWGRTGPTITVTSLSTTRRFTRTSTRLGRDRPWSSGPPRRQPACPTRTKVASSHHSWFTTSQPVDADERPHLVVGHRRVGAERHDRDARADPVRTASVDRRRAAAAAGTCGCRRG